MSLLKNTTKIIELVSLSVSVSKVAGNFIRRIFESGDLRIHNKGDDNDFDPQTEADRIAQELIHRVISKHFPGLVIICEEEKTWKDKLENDEIDSITFDKDVLNYSCPDNLKHLTEDNMVVWVDPLDGTSDFSSGLKRYSTVMIGVATRDGIPVAGILHQPFHSDAPISETDRTSSNLSDYPRTIWGIVGLGPFGLKCRKHLKKGNRVIVTSKLHLSDAVAQAAAAMNADIIHASGAAFKAICVMEEEVDAYVYASSGTKRWDTCATDAIIVAMGGEMTDIFGKKYDYSPTTKYVNEFGIIASLKDHETYVKSIPERVKEYVLQKSCQN